MALTLVSPATAPLISLVEAKRHLRVDHTDDDDYITALTEAVSDNLDGALGWVGRSIRQATWRLDMPYFPRDKVTLGKPPLRSVTTVAYTDVDGNAQTYTTFRTFNVGVADKLGVILPAHDGEWPDTRDDTPDAVQITFVAGYDIVPFAVRAAALLLVGNLYENRESVTEAKMNVLPMAVAALLAPYRNFGVGG